MQYVCSSPGTATWQQLLRRSFPSQAQVFLPFALFDSAVTPPNPWGAGNRARQKTWSCKTNGIISRNKMNLPTAKRKTYLAGAEEGRDWHSSTFRDYRAFVSVTSFEFFLALRYGIHFQSFKTDTEWEESQSGDSKSNKKEVYSWEFRLWGYLVGVRIL